MAGQPPRRRSRKPLLVGLAILVVGCLAAAALFVVAGSSDPDPEDQLADVQDATADATSFRFTLRGKDTSAVGGSGAGSDTTNRVSGKGAWSEDKWETSVDLGVAAADSVYDGASVYERWASSAGSLDDEKWSLWEDAGLTQHDGLDLIRQAGQQLDQAEAEVGADAAADYADSAGVTLAQSIFFSGGGVEAVADSAGLVHDPAAFLDSLEDLSEPKRVEGDLVATFEVPGQVVDAFGHPVPDGRVQMKIGDGDLPNSLRFSAKQGSASTSMTLALGDWNETISVKLPSAEELDETPWVDEEGLTGVTDFPLVWPTAPPAGWEFSTLSPQEFADQGVESDCDLVGLDWDEPVPTDATNEQVEQAGYLYLTLRSADCARAGDDTEFTPGIAGLPERRDELDLREVLVGDTAVEIETSLSDDQLAAVLATMTPVDVQTIIDAAVAPPTDSPASIWRRLVG